MVLSGHSLGLQKTAKKATGESVLLRSIALGLIVICLSLLTGCGTDGNSGADLAIAKPGKGKGKAYGVNTISLDPTGLTFSAIQGGSNPEAQTVTILNSGKETLDWTVSTTAAWLSLSTSSGTTPGSFTATPIIAGLGGTYSATITITAAGATNSPQEIPVDLIISPATSSTTPTTSVQLAWDPSMDPSILGFYVYYGLQSPDSTGSCAYTQTTYYPLESIDASSPTVTLGGLTADTTYFFAVSAYNGVEGPCSNEVWTVPVET